MQQGQSRACAGLQNMEVGGISADLWRGACPTFWQPPLQRIKEMRGSPKPPFYSGSEWGPTQPRAKPQLRVTLDKLL